MLKGKYFIIGERTLNLHANKILISPLGNKSSRSPRMEKIKKLMHQKKMDQCSKLTLHSLNSSAFPLEQYMKEDNNFDARNNRNKMTGFRKKYCKSSLQRFSNSQLNNLQLTSQQNKNNNRNNEINIKEISDYNLNSYLNSLKQKGRYKYSKYSNSKLNPKNSFHSRMPKIPGSKIEGFLTVIENKSY